MAGSNRIKFIISGDTCHECAMELDLLFEAWRENPRAVMEGRSRKRLTLRVEITGPRRDTSVEHCLRYARGELEDGICEAGGSIGDGTHVLIARHKGRGRGA